MSNSSTLLGDFDSEDEKEGLVHTLATSSRQRLHDGTKGKHERKRWDTFKLERIKGQTVTAVTVEQPPEADAPQESFLSVIRAAYPTIPHKPLLALGMLFAVISGSITPLFSFMLSRLLFEVAKGAQDVSVINTFGGIVLTIAIADGLFVGLKFIVFETAAMLWVNRLRTTCYRLVLGQDKWWFDRSENAAVKLCQILTRDGDDARSLISTVFAQGIVVVSMFAVGLIWALVRGWQLTLVGFAIAPVFILTMVVQSRLVAKCELRNKRAREDVAKGYYEVGMSLLTIRLLADHPVDHNQHPRYSSHGFRECFLRALQQIRGGRLAHGCTRRLRGGLYLWRRELPHLYFRGAAFLRWCGFGVAGHLLVLADGSSP
jgi:ATP-binding cassette subfamily B (MDR/TAP) protein 1